MFCKSVDDFIQIQKRKLSQEKINLNSQKLEHETSNVEEKENVPFNNTENSTHLLPNVKSHAAKNLLKNLEHLLDKKTIVKKHESDINVIKAYTEKVNVKKIITVLENMMYEKQNVTYKRKTNQENGPTMLKYGEYSPNNPRMRVTTQPYLGLGEYEQRHHLVQQQRKSDYKQHTDKMKCNSEVERAYTPNNLKNSVLVSSSSSTMVEKSVQTDIQDVNSRLVQYEPSNQFGKETTPKNCDNVVQQIEAQTYMFSPETNYRINNSSSRAKLIADLQGSHFPTRFGYTNAETMHDEKMEKLRRQEQYLGELRQQIEEKQRLAEKHKEQERQEQESARKRFEEAQMHANSFGLGLDDKQPIGRHHYNNDTPIRPKDYNQTYVKSKPRALESSLTHHSDPNPTTTSAANSPPLPRRTSVVDKRPPYSFNIPSNSIFANSLPVKDVTKRKFDETLPIPVLKTQSPVAKELKNAVAVQSTRSSDAIRRLEDKWQIPVVQKNVIMQKGQKDTASGDRVAGGILTQLGAIRLQLQQEQLRLDETLRKRGSDPNTTALTVQADVHY